MASEDDGVKVTAFEVDYGVDVLIHEVMSPALIDYLKSNFSASQAQDVIDYHTTASQAAKIFNETKPKLAVYYHTRNDGPFASSLIDETRTIYDGPLKIGEDLLQISIGDDITTRSLMSHR